MALPAEEPLVLPRVDANVALASLASGRAREIGTKYGRREHSVWISWRMDEISIKIKNEEHGTTIAIRQIKYLNNSVAQDHRAVKRVTRPMLGFKSFGAAQCTLAGVERMPMIRKRQLVVEEGAEGRTAAEPFYALVA